MHDLEVIRQRNEKAYQEYLERNPGVVAVPFCHQEGKMQSSGTKER